jgi:hypothetical protein
MFSGAVNLNKALSKPLIPSVSVTSGCRRNDPLPGGRRLREPALNRHPRDGPSGSIELAVISSDRFATSALSAKLEGQ